MSPVAIVFKKEMVEILRDRRTLIAIAFAALASPIVLTVISQVATRSCLLYTSPSPRDLSTSRMPSSA